MVDPTCPVCGMDEAFDEPEAWEICPRCGWEDDPVQRSNPGYSGGANTLSIDQARQAWLGRLDVLVIHWDVHLMSSTDFEKSDLGSRQHILGVLSALMPDIDLSDTIIGRLRRGNLYMEFIIGDQARLNSMWVLAYGSGDAVGVLRGLCRSTGWVALDTWNTRGGEKATFLDLGKRSERTWHAWQQFRDRLLRERIVEAERAGKRLIFTTSYEVQSSKPVAAFEDIQALGGAAQDGLS